MATANQGTEIRISSEALDLLNCYVQGLDKVVYEIAEQFAKQRMGDTAASGRPVRIDASDVRQAAEVFVSAVQRLARDGGVPPHVVPEIEGMHQCLQEKCAALMRDKPK